MASQLRVAFLLGFLMLHGAGCGSIESVYDLPEEPPEFPTQDAAEISDRRGGTHHATEVEGLIWYQTFGTQLLVLDANDGSELRRVEPLPFGRAGALVDIVLLEDRMYLVADGDAVVELDLDDRSRPVVDRIRTKDELGIRPRAIATIDGDVWVSGDGGVVRLDDSEPPRLAGERIHGPVVATDSGLAVPVGRQVKRIDDGRYLGAATMLEPLPADAGIDGGMLFAFQGSEGASVGVMGPDVRQIDDFVMAGTVRTVRHADGRIWAVTDTEIGTAELNGDGTLGPVEWIKVKGARDLDDAGPNYLAVGGTFGRALYRHRQDSTGDGDTFLAVTREPGNLLAAVDDGRRVLTGSPDGSWLYTIGDSIEIVDQQITMDSPPSDFAAGKWGDIRITEAGAAAVIHLQETDQDWRPPNGAKIRTLVVMGDRIWIGHEEGLSMVRINGNQEAAEQALFGMPPPPRIESVRDLRISSGVSHILPVRVGDQVVWVSPNGGIGVAKAERVQSKAWAGRQR